MTLLCLSALGLRAQVTVEVRTVQDQFLPGETLPVSVRITNRSGQPIPLGAEDDWLTFSIESQDGPVPTKAGDPPVAGEFVLESSKVATKVVDLAPYFQLSDVGRYSLVATVKLPAWGRDVASRARSFDIINGSKLWEQEFGVPRKTGDTNVLPEVRKYMLQQANYLSSQIRLYLRVTDATGLRTFKIFPIGPMISFSRPEAQLDRESNLHVMYQSGPHAFSYTAYDTDGELLARQTYDYANNRPRLRQGMEGRVLIEGGSRRLTLNDVPTPKPEDLAGGFDNNTLTLITNSAPTNTAATSTKKSKKSKKQTE